MSRFTFGGGVDDYIFSTVVSGYGQQVITRSTALTAWSAQTGGIRYTDLLDVAGAATTTLVTGTDGRVPVFSGPDGISDVWLDGGAGRSRLSALDKTSLDAAYSQLSATPALWQAATAYTAGAVRIAPDGTTINRDAAGTSRATYDAAEQALWTAVVAKAGTGVKSALDAAYSVQSRTGSRPVGRDELVLDAADYGIVGDGSVQSLTALTAAINTSTKPSAVHFSPGTYLFRTPLPSVNYTRYYGDTFGTPSPTGYPRVILTWDTGSMLAPATVLYGLTFENLTLATINPPAPAAAATAPLIDLTILGGGLIFTRFDRVCFDMNAAATSVVKMTRAVSNFFDVDWNDCRIERLATHTVPAFDITCVTGVNHLRFRGGWWHSHGCNTTPFFRLEQQATGDAPAGLEFAGVIGEQNAGGMIHIGSANGVSINNVTDYDQSQLAAPYTDDLFKMFQGAGGNAPVGLVIENSGTNNAPAFNAGKYHLNVTGGFGHSIGRIHNGNVQALASVPSVGRVVRHNGGHARSIRFVYANFLIGSADDVVIANGTSLTVTLPRPGVLLDSGTMPYGRQFTIKNVNASSLTVTSVAGGIDGAATVTLAQYAKITVVHDGAVWYTV